MMYNIYIRSTVKRAVKLINSRREKTMKRIIALILGALMLCTVFASCTGKSSDDLADKDPGKPAVSGNDTAANTDDNTGDASSDLAYITGKKKLVIGITEYKPMNYQEDGEWTGFDTEFAKAFCEKLGVEAEFLPIEWDSRFTELKSKAIDCIWNGMTISEDATKNTGVSKAYVKNAQVVVMKADKAGEYTRVEDLSKLTFAAENGSAGEAALKELSYNTTGVTAQSDALMEVASGSTDACVIDITMANAMTGEGTSYKDLAIACELTSEEYGVSFRTGSDMVEKFNEVLDEFLADGTLDRLAEKYSLTLVK